MRYRAGILFLLATTARAQAPSIALATKERPIEVELLSASRTIAPGETTWVALRLKPNRGWHTYWRYAGDVGNAPTVVWTLPAGWTAGSFVWPTPHRMSSPPLASYGYERELRLAVPIVVPQAAPAGSTARIAGRVTWVVCNDQCMADDVDLSISRPIAAAGVVDSTVMQAIDAERQRAPFAGGGWTASASLDSSDIVLFVRPPSSHTGLPTDFFVDSAGVIDHAAPLRARWTNSLVELRIRRSAYANGAPGRVSGVVVFGSADSIGVGEHRAIEIVAPVQLSLAEARSALGAPAIESTPISVRALLGAALLALIGGTLLNLMPCVLPVLSIKLFGITEMATKRGGAAQRHALLFGAGILLSMWALVGVLLAIRAAGAEIGWGYQLQSPVFVSLLALVMVAAALNMAGLFTIQPVGGSLVPVADREPRPAHEIMNGALVVLLATPCSAPFISTAATYGLTHGAISSFAVFSAIAIGLAWPVVLIAFAPSLRRVVPKPGAWMVTLRQFLVFPLLATAAWLAWVVGRQAGVNVMGALLASMTILSVALWAFGRLPHISSAAARYSSVCIATVSLAFAVSLAVVPALNGNPTDTAPTGARDRTAESAVMWQPFTDSTLLAARQSGAPVLLDVTADWCLTCKVNERVAFASDRVRAALDTAKVQLLRADWTSRSPAITRLISGFGRSGVPVVVLYPPGDQSEPVLLPTVLTPGIVIRALQSMPRAAVALHDSVDVADSTSISKPIKP